MKILLANLPWRSMGRTGVRAGSRWPHLKGPTERDYLPFPFFLAYAAALLRKHGFEAVLVDAIAEGLTYAAFERRVREISPDLLVCETSTVTLDHDLRVLRRFAGMPLALCGPDVNIRTEGFLDRHPGVNYVLSGEYEFTLLELAAALSGSCALEKVQGLIWRNGRVRMNAPRPLCRLDDLPWPLREGLPMERYNDTPGDMPTPSVQMLASRGCPFRCKFCLWPQVMYQSNAYRTRDVKDVADEMAHVVNTMGFKSVYFDDDTFNCGRERMIKLCDEIKARRLDVPWAIMARADLMDEALLERMRDAGLFAVKYGVESASQELLDGIRKDMDVARTVQIVKHTQSLGIRTHLTFTFGLPGETRESIRRTTELAMELNPTTLQFSIATPFPGTSFYQEAKAEGRIISERWEEYDGNRRSVLGLKTVGPRDLEQAIRDAYCRWAAHCSRRDPFRPGYGRRLADSLKRDGVLLTGYRTLRFCVRWLCAETRDMLGEHRPLKRVEGGVVSGRMGLKPENGGISLYWEGLALTSAPGFGSIHAGSAPSGWEAGCCGQTVTLRRLHPGGCLETWRVTAVDEKQIDWEISLSGSRLEAGDFGVFLALSRRYGTWVDSWGEGALYPLGNSGPVQLRNPATPFIGVRGFPRGFGRQTPTVFLETGNRQCIPSIRNGTDARLLEVRPAAGLNRDGERCLMNLRIKIIEEDFRRRKRNRRR